MTEVALLGRRAVREIARYPEATIPALFIPLFFLAVNIGQVSETFPDTTSFLNGQGYVAFQLPVSLMFAVATASSGLALVTEIDNGYFDKLLVAPIRRSSIILGRLASDFVRGVGASAFVLLAGLAFGAHVESGPIGALAIVLGAFSWAAGSLAARRLPLPRDTLLSAAMGMLSGGALLALVSGLGGEFDEARFTQDALVATGYMVVVGSFIGFSAYVWLLKVAPASTVSTYAYVNPVIAVLLGWGFNDEVITRRTVVAGAAIVIGVALMVSRRVEEEPRAALSSARG